MPSEISCSVSIYVLLAEDFGQPDRLLSAAVNSNEQQWILSHSFEKDAKLIDARTLQFLPSVGDVLSVLTLEMWFHGRTRVG